MKGRQYRDKNKRSAIECKDENYYIVSRIQLRRLSQTAIRKRKSKVI